MNANTYWKSKGGFDESPSRTCPLCHKSFDSEVMIGVDGYRECFDCLVDDPESKADVRIDHPELFIDFHQPDYYAEKARQVAAYLDGTDASDPEHSEHRIVIERALDRARDIVKALESHLEFENNIADEKASREFDEPPHDDGPPYGDAVDDMDGASELPPLIPHTSLDDF